MSMFDKIAATVMPTESEESRREARRKAESVAESGSWLATVLDHHRQIEAGLDRVRTATDPGARAAGLREFAVVFNGHSIAEELVLYPALVRLGEKHHAGKAYTEQTAAKVQLAELETLDPTSDDYAEKFEHVRGAILHHIYEEENDWLLALNERADATEDERLTQRFLEEFGRYARGAEAAGGVPGGLASGARDVAGTDRGLGGPVLQS